MYTDIFFSTSLSKLPDTGSLETWTVCHRFIIVATAVFVQAENMIDCGQTSGF